MGQIEAVEAEEGCDGCRKLAGEVVEGEEEEFEGGERGEVSG